MMKKVKCENCQNDYDAVLDSCPKCKTRNGLQDPEFSGFPMFALWKQILLIALGALCIRAIATIVELVYVFSNAPFETEETLQRFLESTSLQMGVEGITYVILLAALLCVLWNDIPKLLKNANHRKTYVYALLGFSCMIAFSYVLAVFRSVFKIEVTVNGNQGDINSILDDFPFLSFLIVGIVGPICEELTYRVGLFSVLKRVNKYLAYTISALVFGLIHCRFTNGNLLNELLNLPEYIFAGLTLAYVYDKTGFFGSLTCHVLNNVMSILPGLTLLLVRTL